jgi:hypothetical protein
MRILGVVATGTLLAVCATIVTTILPDRSDEAGLTAEAPAAAPGPGAAKKEKKPAKPKLTRAQRRARAAAVTTLRDQGYRPVTLTDYQPKAQLRVLIGRGDGGQRAFFFVGGQYLGNDAADDSDQIRVARAGKKSVALSYRVFTPGRKKPGRTRVLFRWDGESLAPQTAIPPSAARHAPAA